MLGCCLLQLLGCCVPVLLQPTVAPPLLLQRYIVLHLQLPYNMTCPVHLLPGHSLCILSCVSADPQCASHTTSSHKLHVSGKEKATTSHMHSRIQHHGSHAHALLTTTYTSARLRLYTLHARWSLSSKEKGTHLGTKVQQGLAHTEVGSVQSAGQKRESQNWYRHRRGMTAARPCAHRSHRVWTGTRSQRACQHPPPKQPHTSPARALLPSCPPTPHQASSPLCKEPPRATPLHHSLQPGVSPQRPLAATRAAEACACALCSCGAAHRS